MGRIVGVVAVCVLMSQLSDQNPVCEHTISLLSEGTTMRSGKAEILLNWSTVSVRGYPTPCLSSSTPRMAMRGAYGARALGGEVLWSGEREREVRPASSGVTAGGLSGAECPVP